MSQLIEKWKDRLNWKADKEYFLSFVGMGVVNPDYEDYVGGGGRLEIDTLDEDGREEYAYTDLEIKYLTKKRDELNEFRNKWDFEEVSGKQLEKVINTIYEEFRDGYHEKEGKK